MNIREPQQKNKVRNLLVRYFPPKGLKTDFGKDNPTYENSYLTKYCPKYYHSLRIKMTPQNPLLSKIKRIKKMKRFEGDFNGQIPQVKWSKILANNRKEIEGFPQIFAPQAQQIFWAMTTLHAVKFFFQITKLQLPTYQSREFIPQRFLSVWEAFSQHLRNMRRLKVVEICASETESNVLKSLFKKLNRMPRLLKQLEVLKSRIKSDVFQDIFLQNQDTFAHLTNLDYILVSSDLSSFCTTLPYICKRLRSFLLEPGNCFLRRNFIGLMPPISELTNLQSISINWEDSWPIEFWSHFIPPTSLRRLKLEFTAQKIINVSFDHWKEIKELDALDLGSHCADDHDMLFTKKLTTKILNKVSKLSAFQCQINMQEKDDWKCKPFFVEQVPHLHEHLKKFKVDFNLYQGGSVSFDFDFLKSFKNLEEIDFQGSSCCWKNVRDVIQLLEGNKRTREFPTLKLSFLKIRTDEDLKDLLMKISNAKKSETNLKIILALKFNIQARDDEIMYLDQICEVIESNTIKGLEISLDMRHQDIYECNVDEVQRVLDEHPGLKNFELLIDYDEYILEYYKRDGEKEELLYYPYRV